MSGLAAVAVGLEGAFGVLLSSSGWLSGGGEEELSWSLGGGAEEWPLCSLHDRSLQHPFFPLKITHICPDGQ